MLFFRLSLSFLLLMHLVLPVAVHADAKNQRVYSLPAPTGPYSVGTIRYHLVNKDKVDPYDDSLFRELMVQVWYPSKKEAAGVRAHAAYMPDLMDHMKRLAREWYFIPQVVLDYLLTDFKCYAYENAPLLEQKQQFPVIVLSHGLGSHASLQTSHVENLASHGYVVFGINHTFTCCLSVFPDGRVYPFKFDWDAPDKVKDFNKIVNLWQDDVSFVLSSITQIGQQQKFDGEPNRFYKKLDLNKIGMFGHSMGGATTTQMLRRDKRVKAGVNMDGPLFGADYEEGFKKPYMVFAAENSVTRTSTKLSERELRMRQITRQEEEYLAKVFKHGLVNLCGNIRQQGADAYYVYFFGGGHNTFTDVPLVKDASFLLGCLEYCGLEAGMIEPLRAIQITNALLVDFFNKYLLQKPALLLENRLQSPFKEVLISR